MGVSKMKRKAVFLDRDGVLIKAIVKSGKTCSADDIIGVEVIRDSMSACAKLKAAGLMLIMVTNQPEISRKNLPQYIAEEINDYLGQLLVLDDIAMCPHD